MATYTAPRLVNPMILIALFIISGLFCGWLIQNRDGYVYPILILGFLWLGGLLAAWNWVRRSVKVVDITNNVWHVIYANGQNDIFETKDIRQIRMNTYLGYQEALLYLTDGRAIRLTSHMCHFDEIQTLLSCLETQASRSQGQLWRQSNQLSFFSIIFFAMTVILGAIAFLNKGRIGALFLWSAVLSGLISIIIGWLILRGGRR